MREKLSQDEILRRMADGWELGWSDGIRCDGRFWMQKGGLCKGGESLTLHSNTVNALIKKGKIKWVARQEGDRHWLTRYELVGE